MQAEQGCAINAGPCRKTAVKSTAKEPVARPARTKATTRCPQLIEPGIKGELEWFAVEISQADFASGTYRITQPGYYFLTENIVFDPVGTRPDMPAIGWFAAISIEADNVILDLNQKSIEASQGFVNRNFSKIYSNIALNNAAFPPALGTPMRVFGYCGCPATTDLVPSFVTVDNVVIRNGTLGRSSGSGISGYDVDNLQVYDLVIRDFEAGGVVINGLDAGSFKDICISGNDHELWNSADLIRAQMALVFLQVLRAANPVTPSLAEIDFQLARVRARINSFGNPLSGSAIFNSCTIFDAAGNFVFTGDCSLVSSICLPEGNGISTGLMLCPEKYALGTAFCDPLEPTAATIDALGITHCVEVARAQVCDLRYAPAEVVGMENCLTGSPLTVFVTLPWDYAFDIAGTFSVDDILSALVFTATSWPLVFEGESIACLPAAFVDAVATSSEGGLVDVVRPRFGLSGTLGIPLAGVHGMCFGGFCPVDGSVTPTTCCEVPRDCFGGQCILVKDVHVGALANLGNGGLLLDDIFRGTCYVDDLSLIACGIDICASITQSRYLGADVFGVSFNSVAGSELLHANITDLYSGAGDATGVILHGESISNKIADCWVRCVRGIADVPAFVEPGLGRVNISSRATGYLVAPESHDNTFVECNASLIQSPRSSIGFSTRESRGTLFESCRAAQIFATSDIAPFDLPFPGDYKRAIGFLSFRGECSEFRNCQTESVESQFESCVAPCIPLNTSHAVGFMLTGTLSVVDTIPTSTLDVIITTTFYDEHGLIEGCVSRCTEASAGEADGILLAYTTGAVVQDNIVAVSVPVLGVGAGYGIHDLAGELPETVGSDSIILKNLAYNNPTANYKVTYANPLYSLPLTTVTNSDIHNLRFANPWNNILIEKAPGHEQTPPAEEACVLNSIQTVPC